jgi:hypothetical protein
VLPVVLGVPGGDRHEGVQLAQVPRQLPAHRLALLQPGEVLLPDPDHPLRGEAGGVRDQPRPGRDDHVGVAVAQVGRVPPLDEQVVVVGAVVGPRVVPGRPAPRRVPGGEVRMIGARLDDRRQPHRRMQRNVRHVPPAGRAQHLDVVTAPGERRGQVERRGHGATDAEAVVE